MQWSDIPRDPSSRILRQFAVMWLVFFAALALWHESIHLAVIAGVGGLPGLWKPSLLRPIFVTWMIVVFPIGWLVSQVVLALMFYLLLTPLGLAFRLCGRDVLKLRVGTAESYWELKPAARDVRSYFRQF